MFSSNDAERYHDSLVSKQIGKVLMFVKRIGCMAGLFVMVASGLVVLPMSSFAAVKTWIGAGGLEDWSSSENWSNGEVADGDDVAVFAPPASGKYEFIHHVTPPSSFTGTIVTSNELSFTTSWWTLDGPVQVVAGIADGATWKIGGNGAFVACNGFESHVPPTFTGELIIPHGVTFTVPSDLNEKVRLTGAGTLVLSSSAQLSQALAFVGSIILPTGDLQLPNLGNLANHSVSLADGQTIVLSAHDSMYSSVELIEGFANNPGKWSFNGTISTSDDGTKKVDGSDYPEGAYNKLPPYVKNDVLFLTDDPSQCHTVWYTNRYFRAGDEIGMKFTWTPSFPSNPRIEGSGKSARMGGVFSVCLQGESPTNCKKGLPMSDMRMNHSDCAFGFFVNTYRSDGHPYIGWSNEKQCVGAGRGIGEAVLGISLNKAIDFALTVDKNGLMTVTLTQDEKSVTLTKNYSTQISVRTAKGFYVGFTGASDTWGSQSSDVPWVSHQISKFRGWFRSDYGGNWKDVANGSDFALNPENWDSIQGAADGSCKTNAVSVFENDSTVKLVTEPGMMTMLAAKTKIDRTLPTRISIDIAGGEVNDESGSSGYVGISFGLCGKNTATWKPAWNAEGYYEIATTTGWLYGMLYRWNMSSGSGKYFYSSYNNEIDEQIKEGMNRLDSTAANQDIYVELVLDPSYGFRSRLTKSPSVWGNGSVKEHEWGLDEALIADWNKTDNSANMRYFLLRAVAASKDYSQMTLKNIKVQQITEPRAGELVGEMSLADNASVMFKAGESLKDQKSAFVKVSSFVLGEGAELSISPEISSTSVAVSSVTMRGSGAISALEGAAVSVENLQFTGAADDSTLEVSGTVSFSSGLRMSIPKSWVKSKGRHVIVDVDASCSFPANVQIVTEDGMDVTDKANVIFFNGKASVCFDKGFAVIFR